MSKKFGYPDFFIRYLCTIHKKTHKLDLKTPVINNCYFEI